MPRSRVHLLCLTASAAALSLALTSCGDGSEAQPSETAASESPMTNAAGAETTDAAGAEETASGPAEGEYVPASADGPAQNVPVPQKPPLADEESYEGAQAFLDYLSDARAYAWETGDTSYVRDITADECESCQEEYEWISDHYQEGGWAGSGREILEILDKDLPVNSYGFPAPRVDVNYEGNTVWGSDGVVEGAMDPDRGDEPPIYMHLDFIDGEWLLVMPTLEGI